MIRQEDWTKALASGRLSHAYLVVGGAAGEVVAMSGKITRKLGITVFDREIVRPEGGIISVKTVRELRARLSYKPHSSSHHLVFFPEADALTVEAQNALLKILEEPPSPAVFVLAVPSPERLLPTIVSRCQKVSLLTPSSASGSDEEVMAIFNKSLSRQFALAAELAKNPELTAVCDQWVLGWRNKLRQGDRQAAFMLKAVLLAKERLLTTEASPRLFLEDLILSMRFNLPARPTRSEEPMHPTLARRWR